jgi:MarR family transcriptional regulator, negative regulator of the multidrug operon emrRAB
MAGSAEPPSGTAASDRLENTFAALVVAVSDGILKEISDRWQLGASDAAALVVLSRVPQRIDGVSRQLGLSHSATVRLVDRLVDNGFAVRGRGGDGRSVAVRLTPAGKRRAKSVLAERERVVGRALAGLSKADRAALARIVDQLLEEQGVDWLTTLRICRFCDIPGCEHEAPCPAAVVPRRDSPLPQAAARGQRR